MDGVAGVQGGHERYGTAGVSLMASFLGSTNGMYEYRDMKLVRSETRL